MDDQNTAAATPSEAEKIMTAAGWRREDMGGNVQAWRKDLENGEFALINADGDCDADPLAIVWTAGRYRTLVPDFADRVLAIDPHHTSLARALDRVATLAVADEPTPADEPATAANKPDLIFRDQPSAED
jgi:hypothetical protein